MKIQQLVGKTLQEATKDLDNYRIVSRDSQSYVITDDFQVDRVNLEVENNIVIAAYCG